MNKIILYRRWPGVKRFLTDRRLLRLMFLLLLVNMGCNNGGYAGTEEKGSSVKNDSVSKVGSTKTILFFGNSLTAGYGLDDPSQAFPSLIQHNVDSLKLPYKAINAGVSGETSSGGNSRIDWVLRQPVDVFVLELGANDGLRGIPVSETKKNLQSIVDKVRAKYPGVKLVLAGMEVPPNMGQKYATDFRAIFPELAKKNDMALVSFILKGVGGEASLNQQDGIHPTAEGHKIVAENVWTVMEGMLN